MADYSRLKKVSPNLTPSLNFVGNVAGATRLVSQYGKTQIQSKK